MGKGDGSGDGKGQGQGQGSGKDGTSALGLLAGMCCLIVVVVTLVVALAGLGIAKIVMGAIYVHDCPYERLIPIYLIVTGVAPILTGGLGRLKKDDSDQDDGGYKKKINVFTIIGAVGLLFTFAWLICGSVWIFGNYSDIIDGCGGSTNCCNTSLIKFALAVTIIDWIFIGLLIIAICVGCCALCCGVMCCKPKVEP